MKTNNDNINEKNFALKRVEDKYGTHDFTLGDLLLEAVDIAKTNEEMRQEILSNLDEADLGEDEVYVVKDFFVNYARDIMLLRYHNLCNKISFEVALSNGLNKQELMSDAYIALCKRVDIMIKNERIDTKAILHLNIKSACIRSSNKLLSRDSRGVKKVITIDNVDDGSPTMEYFAFQASLGGKNQHDNLGE